MESVEIIQKPFCHLAFSFFKFVDLIFFNCGLKTEIHY
ncbi:hypothetical protein EV11_0316 [Prochlorococcus sp. SS52]|nr:hypothetical protein EV04_0061 [Prochlorococcus marinus str. LG]KGG20236.1 hypothetical protein EV08_1128 [Prochlorococcus marinus str. SS2]KGG23821.1 hypothetical protein EV09_0423 [Prochlorococcus marinus str. SS35]KGG33096.1 hypothetical protein EV10_0822 [Prochlorococcus marinus str. SS51]KGG37207.1 hypothetical protein EV11_0316 [Prochlorococcus sp. SS52]